MNGTIAEGGEPLTLHPGEGLSDAAAWLGPDGPWVSFHEVLMSAAQLSVRSTTRTLPLRGDGPGADFPMTPERVEATGASIEGKFVLASRDVIDEVQQRMERRGFHWETS